MLSQIKPELFEQKCCIFSDKWWNIWSHNIFFSFLLNFGLGQYGLERHLFSSGSRFLFNRIVICKINWGSVNSLPFFESLKLFQSLLLIDNVTALIIKMRFYSSSLNWAYSYHVFIILFTLRFLFNYIHFSKCHFFRMEVKVLLIIIDRV